MIKCEICNKEFINVRALTSHIRQLHAILTKDYYDTYERKENEGICPVCGKETSFQGFTKGYSIHCSTKCSGIANKDIALQTFKNTIANRSIDEKSQIQLKIKNTMREKYGYACNFLRPDVYKKSHSENARQLQRQTNLQRYGSECPLSSKIIRNRYDYKEITRKGNETKRKNGTLNTSKPENKCYKLLCLKFKDVKRNYKSDIYPYLCDFYIPERDLYIECNFHWTHSKHVFNETNLQDLAILAQWREKAKTSNFYRNAINTWTIRDVEKHNTALRNNLNYICFYSIDEFIMWFEKEVIL